MKRMAIWVLLLMMLTVSCEKPMDLSQPGSQGARYAAEFFYDLLGRGQVVEYVDNMQHTCLMDSSKHAQFVDMMRQFLHEERLRNGGILGATATRDTLVDSVAMVFMDVHFADSTRESIVLPLVYTRGRWWIR